MAHPKAAHRWPSTPKWLQKLWSEFCGPVGLAYTFNKARECISSSGNNSHPLQAFEKDGPRLAKEHIRHFPQPQSLEHLKLLKPPKLFGSKPTTSFNEAESQSHSLSPISPDYRNCPTISDTPIFPILSRRSMSPVPRSSFSLSMDTILGTAQDRQMKMEGGLYDGGLFLSPSLLRSGR
jgi:hypothetical protein